MVERGVRPYYPVGALLLRVAPFLYFELSLVSANLHSPERHLIELRMEHGDLDALIDRAAHQTPVDELMMRRLKKKRLALRDEIARVERELFPSEPA